MKACGGNLEKVVHGLQTEVQDLQKAMCEIMAYLKRRFEPLLKDKPLLKDLVIEDVPNVNG